MNVYDMTKLFNPITTTPKKGVNVRELVKAKYPLHYEKLRLNTFDWETDLDGVLDFLYGEREFGFMCFLYGVPLFDVSKIINLIEANCEVKQ